MRPDALECWNDWGRRGAHRVIVTASPETTVAPFARRLGAENLLGTHMAFDAEDRVTGAFTGPNCRGEEKMRRLRADRTSFVIAHRLSTIRDADTILMMEDGRIVEQGTHEELLAREDAYFRLYQAQFAGAIEEA